MEIMKAQVHIVSLSDGERTESRSEGSLRFSKDGACVTYTQDGDSVLLHVTADSVGMERTGETSLSAVFHGGAQSAFRLVLGGHEAEIPLQTKRCLVTFGKDRLSVRLVYRLLFQDHFRSYVLSIFVQGSSGEA